MFFVSPPANFLTVPSGPVIVMRTGRTHARILDAASPGRAWPDVAERHVSCRLFGCSPAMLVVPFCKAVPRAAAEGREAPRTSSLSSCSIHGLCPCRRFSALPFSLGQPGLPVSAFLQSVPTVLKGVRRCPPVPWRKQRVPANCKRPRLGRPSRTSQPARRHVPVWGVGDPAGHRSPRLGRNHGMEAPRTAQRTQPPAALTRLTTLTPSRPRRKPTWDWCRQRAAPASAPARRLHATLEVARGGGVVPAGEYSAKA